MLQPEKFVCIPYPQIDFLIPSEEVVSSVGVKDLNLSLLSDQESGFFDFDEIASKFQDFYNNISDSYILNTYQPTFSKDPFGETMSNIEDKSIKLKIA